MNLKIALSWLSMLLLVALSVYILKPDWSIRSDGFHYYEYTRSLIFDHDLNFQNENNYYRNTFQVQGKTFYDIPTNTGYYPNPFPIGVGILEAPWVLLVHSIQKLNGITDTALPGFSIYYSIAINIANIVYGFFGLALTYLFLKKFTSWRNSMTVVFTLLFATPLIYFMVYEAIWSHLAGFFAVSLFIYVWYVKQDIQSVKKYLALGALLGLVSLIRWQNLVLIIFLIPEWVRYFQVSLKKTLYYICSTFVTFFLFALPQLVVWKIIYGHFVTKPYSNSAFIYLLHPRILQFLFSPLYGMFWWTPLYIIAFVGLIYFAIKYPKIGWLFIVFLLLQIYINSSLSDWFGGGLGGGSFGARRMLDYSLIYGVGILYFIKFCTKKYIRVFLIILMPLLILINISLMVQAARGLINRTNPYTGGSGLALPSATVFIHNSEVLLSHE
jgi:hypothetical protein